MHTYELLFITEPRITDDALKAVEERIEGYIARGEGEKLSMDDWGTRRLAYSLGKMENGRYVLYTFKAPEASVPKLNRQVKLMADVMRHIIVRQED